SLLSAALVSPAGQAANLSFELQPEQHRRYGIGRQAAALAQSVNITRVVTEVVEQFVLFCRWRLRRSSRRSCDTQLVEHVLGALDELRALLEQRMTALRERRVDRAGDRKDVAALVRGEPRRDEPAASECRLDDHHAP